VLDLNTAPDLNDVQGLTLQPYRYPKVRHLLLHCPVGSRTNSFLSALLDSIAAGETPQADNPGTLTNIALTATGLVAAGLDSADLSRFDPSFVARPEARLTGDVPESESGPSNWWEQTFSPTQIDILVIVHARDHVPLENRTAQILDVARQSELRELIPRRNGERLNGQALPSGRLHFGYKDGISHPDICWSDPIAADQVNYRHFLLGYADDNVYSSPGSGPMAALVRNSSYLVLRWIYQDVARFQLFLRTEGAVLASKLSLTQDRAEEFLAAKMLGRWRDGTPLELAPDGPSDQIPNDASFNYEKDSLGQRCPFSSHIRIVNPRCEPLNAPAQTEGVPRVIRRGMPYGPEMAAGCIDDDGQDRGLIGVFICTNVTRQFYKLTQWISRNDFSPVFKNLHTQDAIFGNRTIANAAPEFTFPLQDGSDHKIVGLPDFVRTKGTEFFLLPSISMLRKLAQMGE
jgi:Dyp-type peroxidase family